MSVMSEQKIDSCHVVVYAVENRVKHVLDEAEFISTLQSTFQELTEKQTTRKKSSRKRERTELPTAYEGHIRIITKNELELNARACNQRCL